MLNIWPGKRTGIGHEGIFFFTSYKRSNNPFCNEKNKWLKSFEIKLSYISNLDLLKQALIEGDKSYFENLVSPEAENSFSEIEIWHIGDAQAYITIKNKEKQIDEKGKTKFEEKELVEYVKINYEILNIFLSIYSWNKVPTALANFLLVYMFCKTK